MLKRLIRKYAEKFCTPDASTAHVGMNGCPSFFPQYIVIVKERCRVNRSMNDIVKEADVSESYPMFFRINADMMTPFTIVHIVRYRKRPERCATRLVFCCHNIREPKWTSLPLAFHVSHYRATSDARCFAAQHVHSRCLIFEVIKRGVTLLAQDGIVSENSV